MSPKVLTLCDLPEVGRITVPERVTKSTAGAKSNGKFVRVMVAVPPVETNTVYQSSKSPSMLVMRRFDERCPAHT